jgi:integrase
MIFKRGTVYWYKFKWSIKSKDGSREQFVVRKSARTCNLRHAREVADEHRRALRLGEIHPLDPWPRPVAPVSVSFRAFSDQFLQHAKTHNKAKTHRFYSQAIDRILLFAPLATTSMSELSGELISKYAQYRRARPSGNSIATVNADLRTLRRLLNLAEEWGMIPRAPSVHTLPGAKGRDRVIAPEEEKSYLSHAYPLLQDLAIVAADTGLRPNSELFTLKWSHIILAGSQTAPYGVVNVSVGKTMSATRSVPLTSRAQQALLRRQQISGGSHFVFPGPGNAGHLMSIKHAHDGAVRRGKLRPFPFYCWRHTFGTRCAESGMDRFTLARLMGHSSPAVAERYYVHVTQTHVTASFEKFLDYHTRLKIDSFPQCSDAVQ